MIICKQNCCTAPSSLTSHLDERDHLQIDEDFRYQSSSSFSHRIRIAATGGLCRNPFRVAEGGHEHDLGGQCWQEEEEEGHYVEEHLEGEEEGHPQSSWTSGKLLWDFHFFCWSDTYTLLSPPAMDGSTWRHLTCWTTTTMWTPKSWLRASPTCSTMSFPNQFRKFLKLVGSGLQQEAPNCVHHRRWWSVGSMLVGLDLDILILTSARNQPRGRRGARASVWSTRSVNIESSVASGCFSADSYDRAHFLSITITTNYNHWALFLPGPVVVDSAVWARHHQVKNLYTFLSSPPWLLSYDKISLFLLILMTFSPFIRGCFP